MLDHRCRRKRTDYYNAFLRCSFWNTSGSLTFGAVYNLAEHTVYIFIALCLFTCYLGWSRSRWVSRKIWSSRKRCKNSQSPVMYIIYHLVAVCAVCRMRRTSVFLVKWVNSKLLFSTGSQRVIRCSWYKWSQGRKGIKTLSVVLKVWNSKGVDFNFFLSPAEPGFAQNTTYGEM